MLLTTFCSLPMPIWGWTSIVFWKHLSPQHHPGTSYWSHCFDTLEQPAGAFGIDLTCIYPPIVPCFHFFFCWYIFCVFMQMTCMYSSASIFTMLNVYDCIILLLLLFLNAKQREIKNRCTSSERIRKRARARSQLHDR